MPMKFGVILLQEWRMELLDISDPIEKYEVMTRVGQEALCLFAREIIQKGQ